MAGKIKLDGTQFLEKVNNEFKITNSELKLKSTGNTIVDSSGNAVVSESGGNVTLGNVRLPSSGGIKDSGGNNILTESGGNVSIGNVRLPATGGIKDSSGNNVLSYPPPTGGKMPTRSPPFRVDERFALMPSMKMSLAFSSGKFNCSSKLRMLIPGSIRYFSPDGGVNGCRVANSLI